jgi:hypothetical protein
MYGLGWLSRYSDWLHGSVRARLFAPFQAWTGAGTMLFLGVKRPGRGVDHRPPSRAEVKKGAELYFLSHSG